MCLRLKWLRFDIIRHYVIAYSESLMLFSFCLFIWCWNAHCDAVWFGFLWITHRIILMERRSLIQSDKTTNHDSSPRSIHNSFRKWCIVFLVGVIYFHFMSNRYVMAWISCGSCGIIGQWHPISDSFTLFLFPHSNTSRLSRQLCRFNEITNEVSPRRTHHRIQWHIDQKLYIIVAHFIAMFYN